MKKIFKKIWKNRPFRTFIQGFFGVFAGSFFLGMDMNSFKALVISACMAGLSAMMQVIGTGEEVQ